jgi:hypothetical protein
MNERIKELAEQAGYKDLPTVRLAFDGFDKEKFAELIVAECINIAYEYDKPKLSGPGLAIASNIESHFDIYIEEDGRFVK